MKSPLLLLGVGGAGAGICRAVNRAFGEGVRTLVVDTDSASGDGLGEGSFVLVGGGRLAGRGSGRQAASAHAAFQDDPAVLDAHLDDVRVAVVVAALAGGTGGGATGEILKRLRRRGIASVLFASLPFSFEGDDAVRNAKAATGPATQYADASILLPLDQLVAGVDNVKDALARAVDSVAAGVTLFWRILAKPGYIRLDAERLRAILSDSGPSRFALASAVGADRAAQVVESLKASPLLQRETSAPLRRIILGVLAGDDLRLAEISTLADGLRGAFGGDETLFDLATVNDEATFSGRLVAVAFLCEENARHAGKAAAPVVRRSTRRRAVPGQLALGSAGRFAGTDKTLWKEEDLDVPTYLRRNLTLDR